MILNKDTDTQTVVYVKEPIEGEPAIIDPSKRIDPEIHITFEVDDTAEDFGLVKANLDGDGDGSPLGIETIAIVGLSRMYYTKARRKKLVELLKDYTLMLQAKFNGEESEVQRCEARFRMAVSGRQEFTSLARAFVRHKKITENGFDVSIPCGASE